MLKLTSAFKFIFIFPICVHVSQAVIAANFISANATRMTFMVNFDTSSIVCQKSSNAEDLALYPISALCDGVRQCLESQNMDDESFPFCSKKCNPSCGPHGTCLLDGGKAQCYCDQGYSGKTCNVQDTNECAKKPCHWLAKCTNTYGSYYCSCLPGFSGDGLNCTDIDECAIDSISKKCPPNSECCNVPGSYFCNCTEGFRPRGTPVQACVDINECEEKLASCPIGTTCVNTIGSYNCTPSQLDAVANCSKGYANKNGICVDVDECRKADACAPRATCQNTEGSYKCTCSFGFTGDGRTCTPLTDCSSNPSVCHPNAFCVSDLRMCLCQSGYIGDGITCFDMNECASDHAVCKYDEKCINTNGSFACCPRDSNEKLCLDAQETLCPGGCGNNAECKRGQCVCKSGYSGNPISGCTDINECKENPNICPDSQWCVNLDGGHICCYHGAPVSKCQGLVIGVWRKKAKTRKDSTPMFNQSSLTTSVASIQTIAPFIISSKKEPKDSTPAFDHVSTITRTSSAQTKATVNSKTTIIPEIDCSLTQRKYCELKSNKTCSILDGHPECGECMDGFISVGGECLPGSSDCYDPAKNDCHERAKCIDLKPYGHLCVCKDGFIGDGKRCDDVDECYTPHICSPNAKCINEVGSFRCVCKPGFVGDGRFCTAVCPGGGFPHLTSGPCTQDSDSCPAGFECQQQQCCPLIGLSINCEPNPEICGENAKCSEKQCVCLSGFTRNGSVCVDVDECLDQVCQNGQKCFNTPGNFACCPGKNLQDKELCADLEKSCAFNASLCPADVPCSNGKCTPKDIYDCRQNHIQCHPTAECNATNGRCVCTPGYIGDGQQCSPDPEDCFLNVKLCDSSRSRCVDRRCQCLDGFHTNGTVCQAETCDNRPSLCHRNADCVQGQCACRDGFAGNGLSCVPDPNDCESYPNLCHSKATCTLRHCQCNEGFKGDGKTCVPTDSKNCQFTPEFCATNAFCNETRCHCKIGYLGDGETGCWADPEDCVLEPSLCPVRIAECVERRCRCSEGYVGNGTHCALEISCQQNRSICHRNAECQEIPKSSRHPDAPPRWHCLCSDGYQGDGKHCSAAETKATAVFDQRPSPLDNQNKTTQFLNSTASPDTPSAKFITAISGNANSSSTTQKRLDDGRNDPSAILPNKSPCFDPSNGECHQNADCIPSPYGKYNCQCRNGFSGDGRNCEDVNECALRLAKCHPLATCVNSVGSHLCLCPQGYSGDGVDLCVPKNITDEKDRLDVECQDDGIVLIYTDNKSNSSSNNFNGRIFVKTQSHNPYCSRDFTSSDGPIYRFKAPFAYCDVKTEPHNTFSTIVVIQKHPLFVTEADEAYNLRCTYPVGEIPLMSHFNVSMLSTVGLYIDNGTMPQCSLRVLAQEAPPPSPYGIRLAADDSLKWQEVSEAFVGQRAQLILNVEPKNLYGLIARNCKAINMDSGESYQLTNSKGCAVDPAIFPEWTQTHKHEIYARFMTFKWPDTTHIRFQCDCSPCFDECEPVQCGDAVGWGRKKRSPFENSIYHGQGPVFSPVLKIRDGHGFETGHWQEDEQETDVMDEYPENKTVSLLSEYYGDSSSDLENVCINTIVLAAALGLAVSLAASLCAFGFRTWYKSNYRTSPIDREHMTKFSTSTKYWMPSFLVHEDTKLQTHSRPGAIVQKNGSDFYRSDMIAYH